jgi:hypothetical protein
MTRHPAPASRLAAPASRRAAPLLRATERDPAGGSEPPPTALRLRVTLLAEPGDPDLAPPHCDTAAGAAAFLHARLGFERERWGVLLVDPLGLAVGHLAFGHGALDVFLEGEGVLVPDFLLEGTGFVVFQVRPEVDLRASPADRVLARWLRRRAHCLGLPIHDYLLLGPPPAWLSLLGRDGAERDGGRR